MHEVSVRLDLPRYYTVGSAARLSSRPPLAHVQPLSAPDPARSAASRRGKETLLSVKEMFLSGYRRRETCHVTRSLVLAKKSPTTFTVTRNLLSLGYPRFHVTPNDLTPSKLGKGNRYSSVAIRRSCKLDH